MSARVNPFRGILFGALISIALWACILIGVFKGFDWLGSLLSAVF